MGVSLQKKTVSLSKGQKVSLSKATDSGLKHVMVGLGWTEASDSNPNQVNGEAPKKKGLLARLFGGSDSSQSFTGDRQAQIDCDAWLVLLGDGDKFSGNEKDVIWYGNKNYYDASGDRVVHHCGDNLVGSKKDADGNGADDEEILIDLDKLDKKYKKIIVGVTIYSAKERHQSFDKIRSTFIRVVDRADDFEICRFNSQEIADGTGATTFYAGALIKEGNEWSFEADGRTSQDQSIPKIAKLFL